MNEIDPILLLIIGLLNLAMTVVWGLSIYLSVKIARRSGRRVWPWVLLTVGMVLVPFGPIFVCIGYLAHTFRRNVAGWVIFQVLSVAAGFVIHITLLTTFTILPVVLPEYFRVSSLPAQLLSLLAGLVVDLLPLIVLSLLGPRRTAPVQVEQDQPLIDARNLHKSYRMGRQDLHVLRGVSLSVKRGEFVAILGASGSGKSTLLHLLGLLDGADAGKVVLDGLNGTDLMSAERDRIRHNDVGFVFQFYHLLGELNVLENTLLPAMTAASPLRWSAVRSGARKRAIELLDRLGLSERLNHRPRELSGGERQRVAIARALINSPKILLADEPTGNLDSKAGRRIMELLKTFNQAGQTIVMVTHDKDLAVAATRVLHLRDGRLK